MSNSIVDNIVAYYMKAIDYSVSWFYFVCNTQAYSKGLSEMLLNTPIEQYANSEYPKETSLGSILYKLFSNRNDETVRKWATYEISKIIIQKSRREAFNEIVK